MLSWLSERGSSAQQGVALTSSPPEAPRLDAEAAAEIAKLFRLYDTDQDGALTKEALRSAIRSCGLSPSEEEQLFHEYDSNGDDLIDLVEFTSMFASTGIFDEGEPPHVTSHHSWLSDD